MRFNKALQDIKKLISPHVDSKLGITVSLINSICKTLCPNRYIGVYESHQLPIKKLINKNYFTIIILLKGTVTGHFVTVHATPNSILYIDPFGLPCFDLVVLKFLNTCINKKKKPRVVLMNTNQIQHKKSVYCGMYAVLYALYFDSDNNCMKLNFNKTSLLSNDNKCKRYINQLIKLQMK